MKSLNINDLTNFECRKRDFQIYLEKNIRDEIQKKVHEQHNTYDENCN